MKKKYVAIWTNKQGDPVKFTGTPRAIIGKLKQIKTVYWINELKVFPAAGTDDNSQPLDENSRDYPFSPQDIFEAQYKIPAKQAYQAYQAYQEASRKEQEQVNQLQLLDEDEMLEEPTTLTKSEAATLLFNSGYHKEAKNCVLKTGDLICHGYGRDRDVALLLQRIEFNDSKTDDIGVVQDNIAYDDDDGSSLDNNSSPQEIDPWAAGAIKIANEDNSSDDDAIPESRYVINRPKPFENRGSYMGATDCVVVVQHELLMKQELRERWCKQWGKQYSQYFENEDVLIANFVNYKSALDVWGEKTGHEEQVVSKTLIERFEMGNLYEPILGAWAVDKRQLTFVKKQPEFQMGNIKCHPDYIVTNGLEHINLEVTTVNPLFSTERRGYPSFYKFLQTQVQMGCANLNNSIIAVAFGFQGIDLFDVPFEPKLFDEICQIVEAFWKKHVVANIVPPSPILGESSASLALRLGQAQRRFIPEEGEVIVADDELNSLYSEFSELSQQEKEVSARLDNSKRKIQNIMIDRSASVIHFSDGTCELKTNKNGVKSLRFNKPKS